MALLAIAITINVYSKQTEKWSKTICMNVFAPTKFLYQPTLHVKVCYMISKSTKRFCIIL